MNVPEVLNDITVPVSRADIAQYAQLSGDHNPIHVDDEAARALGFPGAIAHGMFIMGAACRILPENGIPADQVRSCFARFGRPLVLPGQLRVSGTLIAEHTYEIEAFSVADAERVARLEVTVA
ncbi:MAG: MaoC/PaaZ C-terminal domain-containing protein [Propionibacteriaceae bacterium]